jgi:hypothetical protein
VQRHRRLPRARGAADHDEAGRLPRDERELLGIDEAGDVGQVLVGAACPRRIGSSRRAEPATCTRSGALSAGEPLLAARRRRQPSAALASWSKTPSGASIRSSAAARIVTARRVSTTPR